MSGCLRGIRKNLSRIPRITNNMRIIYVRYMYEDNTID